MNQSIALYNNCLKRRRTDILYAGELTQDVGEQDVGETTRRQNDRNYSDVFRPSVISFHGHFVSRTKSSFTSELGERTSLLNKCLVQSDIYILLDGLTYNTRGYFASCVVFFRAPQGRGKMRAMSKMSASIIC